MSSSIKIKTSKEKKVVRNYILKPLQNKKGQKIWGTREKSSLFPYKRTAFFLGTPNFFGPSYFEAALESKLEKIIGIEKHAGKVRKCKNIINQNFSILQISKIDFTPMCPDILSRLPLSNLLLG